MEEMIMDKLELKDIAGYLPYGVKCQDTVGNKIVLVDERCDLSPYLLSYFSDALIVSENGLVSPYQVVRDEKIKPILFPMKCLDYGIPYKGEQLIPVYELCKACGYTGFYKWEDDEREMSYRWGEYTPSNPKSCDFGWERKEEKFSIWNKPLGKSSSYSGYIPLAVLDKLNELHFDYRGLIERGLAVSALDCDNPYK